MRKLIRRRSRKLNYSATRTLPLTNTKKNHCAYQLEMCKPLEKLATSVPGVICSFRMHPDGTTSMPYVSPAIFDLYGLRPEEVSKNSDPIFSRIHSDDARRIMHSVNESSITMTQWHDEWRFDHPVKGERWIEGRSMPVREPDGSVLWHGYIQDVTERKEREHQLEELNAFLQLLTNAVPALISYVDTDLRYKIVNYGYERWFGHPADKIVGKHAREVLGDDAWEKVSPHISRALAGESVVYEAEIPYKDGGTRWVQASYLPNIDAKGKTQGIVVMVIDLTEHRRIEDELRRTRKQYAELVTRQDSIREAERRHVAREVHDELGQLLTGMRMCLSALRLRREPSKSDVMNTTEQLDKLLDQTTNVVRRISVSLRSTLVEHGLLPALEGLATDFSNMTKVSCRLSVSGETHPVDESRTTTIFRIVQESLTNIARHAQAKSVLIHFAGDAARLRITVQDDGCGFDTESVRKLGCGLGLFGMHERAEIAGGKLMIISSPGKGTRLELDLPFEVSGEYK